jgi:hypothetical protein
MNIVVISRGNVGRGLAALWHKAGSEVTALGRRGGDASGVDVVVVAVPGARHLGGLGPGHRPGREDRHRRHQRVPVPQRGVRVTGRGSEVRHRRPGRQELQPDLAALYYQIAAQRVPPGRFYVTEDGARDIAGQFMTDAGYDPVPLGGLDKARAVEDLAWVLIAAMKDGVPVFDLFAVPGEL